MAEIKMGEFGLMLTGRPYGKDCYEKLSRRQLSPPFVINFQGVVSLGSSFGEEVIVPLAKSNNGQTLVIKAANSPVKDCLEKIRTDFNLSFNYE